jgi:hypothetical protein
MTAKEEYYPMNKYQEGTHEANPSKHGTGFVDLRYMHINPAS